MNYVGAEKRKAKFITHAQRIHGDRYDYSLVDYIDGITKVIVVCSIHGPFAAIPAAHVHGYCSGCPKCGRLQSKKSRQKDQGYFLEKAREMHGDRYDYTPTVYVKCNQKVKVICRKHGEFEIQPQSHTNGHGCSKCGVDKVMRAITYSLQDFIDLAIKKHGTKYDYSCVNYVNVSTSVDIICPIHGLFQQRPVNHLKGKICYKCSRVQAAQSNHMSLEEFVIKSKQIHGDRYRYDLTKYENHQSCVTIICQEHGLFQQKPKSHLNGHGCQKCKSDMSHGFVKRRFVDGCKRKGRTPMLYLLRIFDNQESFLKIGITSTSLSSRFISLGYKYDTILTVSGEPDQIWNLEKEMHHLCFPFTYLPLRKFAGRQECYSMEHLEEILTLLHPRVLRSMRISSLAPLHQRSDL